MAFNKTLIVLVVCALAFVAMAADKPEEPAEDQKAEGSFLHGAYAPYHGGYYGGYGPYGHGYGYGHGFYGHGLGYGGYGYYG